MFKIGDLVRLRCGGPTMVVESFKPAHKYKPVWISLGMPDEREEIEVPGKFTCQWFDAKGRLQYNHFLPELLMDANGADAITEVLKASSIDKWRE